MYSFAFSQFLIPLIVSHSFSFFSFSTLKAFFCFFGEGRMGGWEFDFRVFFFLLSLS